MGSNGIYKSPLDTGEFPEEWRVANLVPLFKKGCMEKPGNYRPVILTSMVSKLLEIILRDKVYMHLDRQELIRVSQHNLICGTILIVFFE